jgi:hypothetical protein
MALTHHVTVMVVDDVIMYVEGLPGKQQKERIKLIKMSYRYIWVSGNISKEPVSDCLLACLSLGILKRIYNVLIAFWALRDKLFPTEAFKMFSTGASLLSIVR